MKKSKNEEVNRRDFLRSSSLSTLMMLMGGVPLRAQETAPVAEAGGDTKPISPPVNCAVIGCGARGREILETLGRLPNAPVVAVCDTYEPFLRRGQTAAPKAEKF